MIFYLIGIMFSVWIIFFSGAEKLENSIMGYFEFGIGAEKAIYIRVSAWFSLLFSIGMLIKELIAL